MTTLLLIRHAANDALQEGRLTGRLPGVHLNQTGRAQAQALAERLAGVSLAAVYSSPMERAQETAQPLAARHGLPVHIHPGLQELDCGRWSGQPLERLRRRPLWRARALYPSGIPLPDGESSWDMQVRIVAAAEEMRAAHPQQTVALVSHADPIRALVAHYLGLPLDLYQRLGVSPASLTLLSLEGPLPRLMCLNETSYLPHSEGEQGG